MRKRSSGLCRWRWEEKGLRRLRDDLWAEKRRKAESFRVHCTASESDHRFKLETMWWQVWENLINSPSAQRTDSSVFTWFLSASPDYSDSPVCHSALEFVYCSARYRTIWQEELDWDLGPNICVNNIIMQHDIKCLVFHDHEIRRRLRNEQKAISWNACNSTAFTAWMVSVKNKPLNRNPFVDYR